MTNVQQLRRFGRLAGRAALLLDYDGCLAPIVGDPALAVPHPDARDALRRLVPVMRRVAVISGRPVAFLRSHLGIDGLVYSGQYGLERADGDAITIDPRVEPYIELLASLAEDARAELDDVLIEDKGGVALALHWRQNPDLDEPARAWARRAALEHGLALFPGRMVVELRPPLSVDKGTAVEQLCSGVRAAAFAGDDRADLACFDALDRLEDADTLEYALRVGVVSDEAPGELLDRSDLQVQGPEGVVAMLRALADEITDERA
ncbi:MAG TPA: trehalose-phosphatase [Acidimicrobiia bacterium]|jgi:trehalose 6-phosphate phosphatase